MQQVGVLVKHEFVAVIQYRQKPPPCFLPVPHTPPLEHNSLGFVSALTLGPPRTRRLRELNGVLPVLKAGELNHKEKVVGGVGLRRPLDLQSR